MKRVIEDFVCLVCGEKNIGNGYTDHCKKCLWGKHVDWTIPGDRQSPCKGLLEPKKLLYVKGKFRIEYKCKNCSHVYVVDVAANDDKEKLNNLMRE